MNARICYCDSRHGCNRPNDPVCPNAPAEQAVVVHDESDAWNVEYLANGTITIRVGCMDRVDAEQLAECLNNASWVETLHVSP